MSWILSDDDQQEALEEIEQTESDRAAAIVAVAFVERDLQKAIEARLLPEDKLKEKLFRPTGPLGAFETKADVGFLLGVYDADTHFDLCCLAWIRNQFAHRRQPISFNSRDIRKKCNELRLVDKPEYPKIPGRGLPDELRSPPRLAPKASPRDRFVLTVKLAAIVFWTASHDLVIPKGRLTKYKWTAHDEPKSKP